MTKKRFSDILKEYNFSDNQIKLLWDTKPNDNISEQRLRKTAKHIAPKKDVLIQK